MTEQLLSLNVFSKKYQRINTVEKTKKIILQNRLTNLIFFLSVDQKINLVSPNILFVELTLYTYLVSQEIEVHNLI